MSRLWRKHGKVCLALVGATLLCTTALPLQAQTVALGRPSRDCYQPVPPSCATTPPIIPMPGVTPPDGQAAGAPLVFPDGGEAGPGRSLVAYTPPMLGDLLVPSGGFRTVVFGAQGSTPTARTFRLPSAGHGFKMADDNSPRPQDRIFMNYNFYSDVNTRFDGVGLSNIGRVNVHHEVFGFEKTFLDRNASFEMRLPLNTLDANGGSVPGLGGSSTDVGDLTVVLKGVLLENRETGNLLSGGLAVTVPTGPTTFAGVQSIGPIQTIPGVAAFSPNSLTGLGIVNAPHETLLQPWVGFILGSGDFFVHGFSAVDIATQADDVSIAYQDIGVGYNLFRSRYGDRVITAITPTLELHVNTPLNHRGSQNGPFGTPDWVDFTSGTTLELFHRATLSFGMSVPVTGPRPYDWEGLAQLNIRF